MSDTADVTLTGRRRPPTRFGDLPDDLQPGDYWRYVNREGGEPMSAATYRGGPVPSNLTDSVWGYYSPDGNGLGTLVLHTVREHEDGTISVLPGDGSTNSILHKGARDTQWHGYIRHGVWGP